MKKISFFIILISLFACNEKLLEKPENLIPKEKMVKILKEISIINAAKNSNAGLLRDTNIDPTDFVFNKYKIDSAQFVESDKYYASMPLEYESIYKEVDTLLYIDKENLRAIKKAKDSIIKLEKKALKKRQDSIKKAKNNK